MRHFIETPARKEDKSLFYGWSFSLLSMRQSKNGQNERSVAHFYLAPLQTTDCLFSRSKAFQDSEICRKCFHNNSMKSQYEVNQQKWPDADILMMIHQCTN